MRYDLFVFRTSILLSLATLLSACSATGDGVALDASSQMASVESIQKAVLQSPDGEQISIPIEVADEPEERSRGLMYREALEGGMLFVFPDASQRKFWMKNTLIPLDIFYFDAERKLDSIRTMQPCKKSPCPTYDSAGPSMYALETNAGYAMEHGIGEGWILEWEE